MVVDETTSELLLLLNLNRGSVALSSLKSFVSAWDEEHETAWTLGITWCGNTWCGNTWRGNTWCGNTGHHSANGSDIIYRIGTISFSWVQSSKYLKMM